MSVSIYIHGMTAPDEKFNKLKAVYNACIAAGLEIPDEVEAYFDGENPNELEGADVDIDCAIIKGMTLKSFVIETLICTAVVIVATVTCMWWQYMHGIL